MENGYGLYSQGSSGWTSMRNEEFEEGDVWEVLSKTKDSDSTTSRFVEEPSLIAKRPPTKTKMIPKSMITKNPASQSQEPKMSRQSAPVNVPDWSKLHGTSSKKSSSSWLDPNYNDDRNNHHYSGSWERGRRPSNWRRVRVQVHDPAPRVDGEAGSNFFFFSVRRCWEDS